MLSQFVSLTPLLVFLKGIAKLPFIDEARLLLEVKKIEHTLMVWCFPQASLIYFTSLVAFSLPQLFRHDFHF